MKIRRRVFMHDLHKTFKRVTFISLHTPYFVATPQSGVCLETLSCLHKGLYCVVFYCCFAKKDK